MAERPVFVSESTENSFIHEVLVNFQWYPGMAVSQKQKSIRALHDSAEQRGFAPLLEISSKSENPLGVKLSAFNLKIRVQNLTASVESVYQGSKVFSNGGPYTELYQMNSREARKVELLHNSGQLIGFDLKGERWDLFPETSFYDWLYIKALIQNDNLAKDVLKFKAFTDIEYNPNKQVSCQARSAAYFVSLYSLNLLGDFIKSKEDFIKLYKQRPNKFDQLSLRF